REGWKSGNGRLSARGVGERGERGRLLPAIFLSAFDPGADIRRETHELHRTFAGGGRAPYIGSSLPLDSLRFAPLRVRMRSQVNIRPMCAVQDSFKHWTAARRRIDYPSM